MNPQLTNPRADEIDAILKRLPFAQTLGMRCEVLGDEMTAILPFQEKLIGNVAIRALHGGAIASFLELTAMLQVFLVSDMPRPPKPICRRTDSKVARSTAASDRTDQSPDTA